MNGSPTNIILCRIENEILLTSVQYLMKEGYKVDVLVFDGCMIRKEENQITNDLLSGLSAYVYEKTKYKIEFVDKKSDDTIDLNLYDTPNNDIEATITYCKDKEEFEKSHLKIVHLPIYIFFERKRESR